MSTSLPEDLDAMEYAKLPPGAATSIKPFKINIPQQTLDELKTLIRISRIAPVTYESLHADVKNGKFGISHEWLTHAREVWLDFNWKKVESCINLIPQFMTQINHEGFYFDIHFTGVFSQRKDAVPLLFLHGWPGSFMEFLPITFMLIKKYTPATLPYHLIIPSLPGYAFSTGPPTSRNFTEADNPAILDKLMQQLGFGDGYIAQGGDIGSGLARLLVKNYPSCKAAHVNYINLPTAPKGAPSPESLSPHDQKLVEQAMQFSSNSAAYAQEQRTRPSTLGFVLQSSPIALLAWIGEKFLQWTDDKPPVEVILESVTLYWVTDTVARCLYPYRLSPDYFPITKPFGYSCFAKEIVTAPKSWVECQANLVFHRTHRAGGHFAALERPEILFKDIEDFVAQVWPTVNKKE